MVVLIGAEPPTGWLADELALDPDGFILTGPDLGSGIARADPWRSLGRGPFLVESSRPGVFAIGDVRSGSTRMVAPAAGDGGMAVRFVGAHLAQTHEHPLESSRNLARVPAQGARSIDELVALIADRAAATPAGGWIQTTMGWNESNRAECRLPTAIELDRATDTHPVLVAHGGHVAVANTRALQAAGLAADTPDPQGGTIGHLEDGSLSGLLEGWPAQKIKGLVPPPPLEDSVANLAEGCRIYGSLGVGTVREALLYRDDWPVYQTAWERGKLTIRARPMIFVPIAGTDEAKAFVDGLGARSGFGDDRLRIWGLKFVADGGVAGAAMDEPESLRRAR